MSEGAYDEGPKSSLFLLPSKALYDAKVEENTVFDDLF